MATVFDTLNALNVNEHTEGKRCSGKDLTYLSWTWAWSETKKRFPEANYEIVRNPATGLPYVYDENTGYMVFTKVTINGITHEMWLPVMDGSNKAMKAVPGEWKDRYGKPHPIEAATMFDINKTLMRCLTKNLAMHGLGLYIYAGEDLPDGDPVEEQPKQEPQPEKKPEPKKTAKKSEAKPEPKQEAKKPAQQTAEPPQTSEKPKALYCDCCGEEIKQITLDGKTHAARMVANVSYKRFGQKMCYQCYCAAVKAEENK